MRHWICMRPSWEMRLTIWNTTYTAQGSTLVLTSVECILTNPPTGK
ncbi:Protein CBG24236 [Caenorhabditis briggsae]|uniref:Protein CBG24236 n=1 Tax=Caenorhabditis briggsae TaxID=6238 RepID=B0K045_CAEBR|nr:Protein CBG24236 [Caenorhabditis briggsae]CAP20893.1 Protein CBG24236 [Caenorhabditis briggsae]